jgi:hypothetical protein
MKLALSIAEKVTNMATGAVGESLGIQAQVLEFALKSANAAQNAAGGVVPGGVVPGGVIPGGVIPGGSGGTGLPGLPNIPGVGSNPSAIGLDMAQAGIGLASSIMNQFLGGMGGGIIPGVPSIPGFGG